MITFNGVHKTFSTKHTHTDAVKDVSLTITQGTIHGIIGQSGAGKSTLIRLINQLEAHDTGTINVLGYTDIRRLNKESMRMLRRSVGMIFQHFNLLESKTVLDNVLFPLSANNLDDEKSTDKALTLIKQVGLEGYEHTTPAKLSGGMKQRVGIARALINDPAILLCDEPTSALDVQTTGDILDLIRNIQKWRDLTVVLVTHDMHVIKEVCDHVTVMHEGHIVEGGTLDDILFNASHPVTQTLTSAIGYNVKAIAAAHAHLPNLTLLRFPSRITTDEILSNVVRDLSANINILFANITPSKEGLMLVSINSDVPQQVKTALTNKGVSIVHDQY